MPHWAIEVDVSDVFLDVDMPFLEQRNIICERLYNSTWKDITWSPGRLPIVLDDLMMSQTYEEFNAAWDDLYDIADFDRVWINTV